MERREIRKRENKIIDSREGQSPRPIPSIRMPRPSIEPYEPRIRKEPMNFVEAGQLYRSNEKNSSPFFSHGRRRSRDDASS